MANKSKRISELPALSVASLDTTYIVGISGSTTYKISVNQLTSSLDSAFATDLVTAALSSSLDGKLSTSSFNQYTASFTASVNINTGSLATTGSNTFNGNETITGSLFISGATELGGNIVPKTARGATLGTSDRPFSDIFVSSGSINIASDIIGDPNTTLSNVGGNILVSAGGMRLVGNASFIAATGSFQYLSGSFTHIGAQFNNGDIVTTGSLQVSGSTVMIGNNTMQGNTLLSGSFGITGSTSFSELGNTSLLSFSSSLNSRINAATNEQSLGHLVTTSSFNSYTASQSTSSLVNRLNAIENVSGSWITESETGSFQSNWMATSGSSQILNVNGTTGPTLINIGKNTGLFTPPAYGVAIGNNAGESSQGEYGVAIGNSAGQLFQGTNAVAIGSAGYEDQGQYAVAIGSGAGDSGQGQYAIAIGAGAGANHQTANSIILDATNGTIQQAAGAGLHIAPIRSGSTTSKVLNYNTTTKEITYITSSFETIGRGIISGSSQLTSSYDTRYTLSGSVQPLPSNLVSSSAQITAFGFISSSQTIDSGSLVTTSSFNSYTASISTASLVTSISNLNTFTASQSTASLVTSISNLNTTTASLNISVNALNTATSSYETKGRGIWSGSAQLPSGIVSGSSQTIANLPTGTVSGSSQVLGGSGVWSGSAQLPTGVVSGSAQTILNLPTGVVSGSSQLTSSYDNRYIQTGSFNTFTSSYNTWTSSLSAIGTLNVDYNYAGRITSDQTGAGSGNDIIFNYANVSSGISLNTSTGVFTLTANKTYKLFAELSFSNFSDTANGYIIYDWVDATTNTRLATTGIGAGVGENINRNTNEFNATSTTLIYTPTTNQTIKVRIVEGVGTVTVRAGIGTKATIEQINPSVALNQFSTLQVSGSLITSGSTTLRGAVNVGTGSGNEGGEIDFALAQTTTLTGSAVVVDVYQDRLRIFEGGGNSRGVHVDLSKAPAGVGGELLWKTSGLVNAGTFLTLDNLKCTVTTGGSRGLSIGAVSTNFTANVSGWYGYSAGGSGNAAYNITYTTTASNSAFGWSFTTEGDTAQYNILDKTNSRMYRVTMMIGFDFNNNFISIERLY
jgi:hypothetical protein